MSITTKRGDAGETDLLYGKRVPKTHPRMVALGAVDELTSALGLVRVHAAKELTKSVLPRIQKELIAVMGLMAVAKEDFARYTKDGFSTIGPEHVETLTREAAGLEKSLPPVTDWVLPEANNALRPLIWIWPAPFAAEPSGMYFHSRAMTRHQTCLFQPTSTV